MKFPHYNLEDIVSAERLLISSPFPNVGRRGVIDFLPEAIIKADPGWKDGNYDKNPDGARHC